MKNLASLDMCLGICPTVISFFFTATQFLSPVFLSVSLRLCHQQLADNRLPIHSVAMKAADNAWVHKLHLFLFFFEISCVYSLCGLYECKKSYICYTPPDNKQCDSNMAVVVNSCQGRIYDIFMNSSDKFNGCLVYVFFFFLQKFLSRESPPQFDLRLHWFANVPINKY